MKILHVIDSLDLYRGGPVVCVASIAAAQAMQGNHITVIAYELNDADKFNDFLKLNVPGYENVNFLYIEGNSALEKLCARNASVVLKDVIPHVDIVHIHGIWSPILYSASKISIKYGKKYVLTPHGMLNPWSLSHKKFKKLIALLLVWKNIIRNSYFVHALNDEEKKFIGLLNITLKINVVSIANWNYKTQ